VSEVFKVSLEMSEEVSNLKQIQKDTLDTFVGGGEGEKFDYFLPDGTRVVIVEQQLLATLKLCWGLDLSEDAPEHPQKTAQTAQPLPQLQPQIQILMGGSRAELPSKPPVEPPNSKPDSGGRFGQFCGG
jgi:hypothetical protein